MTDTRDPRVAELVTRVVELAPPAPPFPDEVTPRADGPRRRAALVGVAIAAAIFVGAVAFVASRPTTHPAPVSPSTTTPTSSTTVPIGTPLIRPTALAVDANGTL